MYIYTHGFVYIYKYKNAPTMTSARFLSLDASLPSQRKKKRSTTGRNQIVNAFNLLFYKSNGTYISRKNGCALLEQVFCESVRLAHNRNQ